MEVRKISIDGGEETGSQLYNAIQGITLAAMASNMKGNQVQAIQVGVSAVAGAIAGVAAIIGQRDGITAESSEEDQASTVNPVSTLVAALLVAKATKNETKALKMELNPIVYLAAINAARGILGRDIDDQLNPGLVGAARRWEKENGVFGGWEQQTHDIQIGPNGGALH